MARWSQGPWRHLNIQHFCKEGTFLDETKSPLMRGTLTVQKFLSAYHCIHTVRCFFPAAKQALQEQCSRSSSEEMLHPAKLTGWVWHAPLPAELLREVTLSRPFLSALISWVWLLCNGCQVLLGGEKENKRLGKNCTQCFTGGEKSQRQKKHIPHSMHLGFLSIYWCSGIWVQDSEP